MAPLRTTTRLAGLVVCLLSLLVAPALGLSLRKQNVENKLHDALKVIERQKRHTSEADWDNQQVYLPMDERASYEREFELPSLRDLYEGPYLEEEDDQGGFPEFDWRALLGDDVPKPVAAEDEEPQQEPVSEEELQDIFGEKENKRSEVDDGFLVDSPFNAADKSEYAEDENKRASDEDTVEDNTLSEEEVNALLSGADDALDEAASNEQEPNPQEVSEEEIKNIFDGIDDESDESPDDKNINKEWLLNQYMSDNAASPKSSTKRKRSNWQTYPDTDSGYDIEDPATSATQELVNELEIARADIKILTNLLALEDQENADLAKALNLATKSQTERSDKYVQDEIEYIRDAIKDEMDLQEIKEVLDAEEETPDLTQTADKRGGYPQPPLDADVEEEEEAEDAIPSEDLVKLMLASKLKQLLEKSGVGEVQNDVYGKSDWFDSPSEAELGDSEDVYLNPLMRELWQKLQGADGGVSKRGDESEPYQMSQIGENVRGTCPAVEEFTDDCVFMEELGLGLDEEASDLCNRHQLCYTCGAALQLSPTDCDRGYLSEAAMLCEEKGGCDEDAAGLFVIMLKHHQFQSLSRVPDECGDPCAEEYIAGTYSRKRK